jgi:hypothetical protein
MPSSSQRTKLRYRLVAALTAFVLIGLAAWAFVIEPDRLVVRAATIALPDWPREFDGLRIAAISDLHVGANFLTLNKLRQVVSRINAEQPDLIVLLGDYVKNDRARRTVAVEPEVLVQPLRSLRAGNGVYAVLGNHDWWYDGAKVRRAFEEVGIAVIDNDAVRLTRRGSAIWLAGLGDQWTLNQDIERTLGRITDNAPVIAITHTPDLFPELPARFRLLIAGHTHGGQVSLPLLGRLVVPSRYGSRYAIGHIEENGRHLFVTPGIGTSILPLRFRVPPEISVITLTGQQQN